MGRLPKKKDDPKPEAPAIAVASSLRPRRPQAQAPLPAPQQQKHEKKKVTEKVKKAKSMKIEKQVSEPLKKSKTKPKIDGKEKTSKSVKPLKLEPLPKEIKVPAKKAQPKPKTTEKPAEQAPKLQPLAALKEKPKPAPKKVIKKEKPVDSENRDSFLKKREPQETAELTVAADKKPNPLDSQIQNPPSATPTPIQKEAPKQEKEEPRSAAKPKFTKSMIEDEEEDDMEALLNKNASGKTNSSQPVNSAANLQKPTFKYNTEDFVREAAEKVEDVYYFTKPPLGTGHFGTVYKCKHKKTGNIRAIKRIKKDNLNAKNIESLLKDVEILKTLDHPNIIKVYEYFQDEAAIYIVTDLCSGGELFEHILKEKNFSEKKAAILMRQILSAISYCHDRKLVHCDLKPENIMFESLSSENTVKIIDFGNSSFCEGDQKLSNRFGSVYYVAPEVLKSSYNEKCDIWSLGVILYLILSGKPPFNGANDQLILKKVYDGKYSMDGPEWESISPEAKDLIKQMLTYDETKRVSAKKCLEHKWICETGKIDEKLINQPLNRRSLRNLKSFRAESQLQGAILSYVVYQLASKEEREDLTNTFMTLDTDHDGKLTKEDLVKAYEKLGEDPETVRKFVDDIIKKIDKDEKGYINYTEYMTASLSKRRLFTEERLEQAFKLFDEQDQGYIDIDSFKAILNKGEFALIDESLWTALIQEATQGADRIDFESFQKMMSLFTQNEQVTQSLAL